MRKTLVQVLVVGLLCALMAACGSNVSKENYDKIATGMTQSEVEGILGKGTEEASGAGSIGKVSGSGKIMKWTDGSKTITITFANDKVVTKAQSGL